MRAFGKLKVVLGALLGVEIVRIVGNYFVIVHMLWRKSFFGIVSKASLGRNCFPVDEPDTHTSELRFFQC